MRLFIAILTLVTAVSLAAVAAWFSVSGWITIFSAAAVSVAVMTGLLELAKLVIATWLKLEWEHSPRRLKYPLSAAVVVLMLLTSMGTFGYLSKAHLEAANQTGPAQLEIVRINQEIERLERQSAASLRVLEQLDRTVDQLVEYGRISGPDGARAVRNSQREERSELNAEIEAVQQQIAELNAEKQQSENTVRTIELEVGPIKYIAEAVYGENSPEVLDKAVKWVIIILVVIFDPVAVLMLVAANHTLITISRKKGKDPLPPATEPEPDEQAPLLAEPDLAAPIFNSTIDSPVVTKPNVALAKSNKVPLPDLEIVPPTQAAETQEPKKRFSSLKARIIKQ